MKTHDHYHAVVVVVVVVVAASVVVDRECGDDRCQCGRALWSTMNELALADDARGEHTDERSHNNHHH